MEISTHTLLRFIYSHYFFSGLRQALGVLSPALILGGLLHWYDIGVVASIGAACVAILDQPGGPRRYGRTGMLLAIALGSLTAALTGLATGHMLGLWLLVPALAFFFSMFTVFGKQGGLLGFACLLLMTLTMRTPMDGHAVLAHTAWTFLGGLYYFSFSTLIHRLSWHRAGLQALSVAMFATADYIRVRSQFYDMAIPLDESYRRLIARQASMTESQQAARDVLLRDMPHGRRPGDHLRIATLNAFTDMVALVDNMIATQTDYATLRERLPDSDVLIFSRDALHKMSINLERIALDLARNRPTERRESVKAELWAIEYELEKYRRDSLNAREPEVYALLVQILRRLRNAARIIQRLAGHVRPETDVRLLDQRLKKSFARFLSRQDIRLSLLTSNLRMDSPHFRYALRVTAACFIAMSFSALLDHGARLHALLPGFTSHHYWIILTLLVIMKPGYALTRQRNTRRLAGTLIGCILALVLFKATDNVEVYLALMVAASIMGYSLIQLSYLMSAIFNTVFVLLVFHFLSGAGMATVGERLFDTIIASGIAFACSTLLPWWEHNFMASLAKAAWRANRNFLAAGLNYAHLTRAQRMADAETPDEARDTLVREQAEAETAWRLTHQQAYTAFSNFAAAFYRMMDEPERQQVNVAEFNRLLLQYHILASQIAAAVPVLADLDEVPPGIQASLDAVTRFLADQPAEPPAGIETEGELATLAYPIRQMVKASRLIREEMHRLTPDTLPPPPEAAVLNPA
ncbi:MAG: FUSC family membrane protein [Castellaniella sp.]